MYRRCQSLREEKRRKEEEEKEARKRAEEEERKRREEEEEAIRRAEEEEKERKRMEEEEARRKAEEEEEEARRRAEEEEAAQKELEVEKQQELKEPQTREDPDIELVTEEMLDDHLPVHETEERGEQTDTGATAEEEQAKDEELEEEELDLEINGTSAEAGPQLDEKEDDVEEEDLEKQTLGESDSKAVAPSDGVTTPVSPGEASDVMAGDTSASSSVEQKRPRTAVSKGPLSRSQEKREQRRRRGLEHNQRETERASSSSSTSAAGKDEVSPPKNKTPETSRLKERADSKELDQYTFVAWKMKEDKGAKKEAKSSPPSSRPVRPSTLPLQPAEPVSEKNGTGEGAGAVNLHRRPGAIKEKPEKWRGRRSDGELPESTSPPQTHNKEERKKRLYVFSAFLDLPFLDKYTIFNMKSNRGIAKSYEY